MERIEMKTKLLVLLAALMILSSMSVSACANKPEDEVESDGVWCYLPRPRDPSTDFLKVAGNNYYQAASDVGEWTGVFTGTSEDYGVTIEHRSGRIIYIGTVLFDTIEVEGSSGGLELYATGVRPDRVSDWTGTWVVTSGTGELESLQGHGTFWGPGWQGNYSDCGVLEYSVEELGFIDNAGS
jgi:ABC-type Fe3+-hydroxamate transport system substrate-binding protein